MRLIYDDLDKLSNPVSEILFIEGICSFLTLKFKYTAAIGNRISHESRKQKMTACQAVYTHCFL
jgi:hypothetical protein